MDALTNLRGKKITLPLAMTQYNLRSVHPSLFIDVNNSLNRYQSVYALEIKSESNFLIQLENNNDGVMTEEDTITASGTRRFFMEGIGINNIFVKPTINNQEFYIYLAGN